MDTTATAIISAASIGALAALDNRSGLKIFFTNAISSSMAAGIVLGDWRTGFMAGALLQMMFLGIVPVRGAPLPDLPLGGVVCAAFAIIAVRVSGADPSIGGLSIVFAIAAGIATALAGREIYRVWEKKAHFLADLSRQALDKGRWWATDALHFSTLIFHFCLGFAIVAVAVSVGLYVSTATTRMSGLDRSLDLSSLEAILPFIGASSLALLQYTRMRFFFFLVGFVCVFVAKIFSG